jgi:hypothetical protein
MTTAARNAASRKSRAFAEGQMARLRELVAGHEADERVERAELPSRSSFDDSAEGSECAGIQMHWSRALLQTPGAIARLQDAQGDSEAAAPSPRSGPPQPAAVQPPPAGTAEGPDAAGSPRQNELSCPQAAPHPMKTAMPELIMGEVRH